MKGRNERLIYAQEYSPGDIAEFDFGTVKLKMNDGSIKEFQMAVFTAAYSNYRWVDYFQNRILDAS
ncbi:hypothetical protein [Clostridium oryzae]|uniref:hypothetical protein n=1 Tax=Clostridium oryzae TaxID=1450648 RepID=UPI001FA8E83A|nr:hypothetical protein [Clostridium oryzae]